MSDSKQRPYFHETQLLFEKFGYFVRLLEPGVPVPGRPPGHAGRWRRLYDALDRAMRGDFTAAGDVLEVYRESHGNKDEPVDYWIKWNAIIILGHIGTVECFRDMRREIEAPDVREADRHDYYANTKITSYCRAFALWGRLDALPVILDQYLNQRMKGAPELGIFGTYLSDLLLPVVGSGSMIPDEPPADMLEDYLNLVMDRYDEVVAELGSETVHVAFGELLSPRTLARHICAPIGTHYLRHQISCMRERFEPMTGIDCTDFFTSDPWTPLAAAAIAEDFLASDASARFEDGARYFFGHRIPD
ncbi:hypothetical protein ENSA5_39650 [Enhygromyxa salina]|uniref:Uncharacterized protein n=1 Tax=Enhygromyxa salina TaxID=215803 RepID=A0A2S9XRL3_9BACT|nr:hypothetical protein [Enhygromyxa salina]PRP95380.1 hypothetical protein ENSA5_39650 [Enhygromyxa salina]